MGGLSSGSTDAGDGVDTGDSMDIGSGDVDAGDGIDGDAGDASGHDGDAVHGSDFGHIMSQIFGVGQVPLSLLLGIYMFCWGACGMAMNQLFSGMLKYPAIYIWPSLGATFVISFIVTRSMAAIVAKMMPREETFGVSRQELVGLTGKAVYAITAKAGTVDISDKYGTVHREQAKIIAGDAVISAGTKVLVLDYDASDKKFVVKAGGF
jgi:membrane protein implicated in regulation of membrane protease activity